MATEIKLVVPERFKCATQSQPKEMMSAIEWIVDMNVTLSSSASKSKTIQRVRNVVIVLVAAVIAIALVYLKMEMRELQVQVRHSYLLLKRNSFRLSLFIIVIYRCFDNKYSITLLYTIDSSKRLLSIAIVIATRMKHSN